MDITKDLPFIASLFRIGDPEYSQIGMWAFYLTIVLLCAIVYHLGFAKKLPVWKTIVVYFVLALGCSFLTFLSLLLPLAEVLVIAALFLGIYKYRLHREMRKEAEVGQEG